MTLKLARFLPQHSLPPSPSPSSSHSLSLSHAFHLRFVWLKRAVCFSYQNACGRVLANTHTHTHRRRAVAHISLKTNNTRTQTYTHTQTLARSEETSSCWRGSCVAMETLQARRRREGGEGGCVVEGLGLCLTGQVHAQESRVQKNA